MFLGDELLLIFSFIVSYNRFKPSPLKDLFVMDITNIMSWGRMKHLSVYHYLGLNLGSIWVCDNISFWCCSPRALVYSYSIVITFEGSPDLPRRSKDHNTLFVSVIIVFLIFMVIDSSRWRVRMAGRKAKFTEAVRGWIFFFYGKNAYDFDVSAGQFFPSIRT